MKVAVLSGDGIGPEIVAEAVKVLRAVGTKFDIEIELTEALVGGIAYDATGHPLPPETLALCKASDAILLGAVGGPKYDTIEPADLRPERGALLPLRKHLGLYANLRPAILSPALASASSLKPSLVEGGLDILVVRELTGGLYFGQPKSNDGERAVDTCVYTRPEIERIAHVGFQAAQKRGKKLASVDKANVLETSRLWRTTVHEIAKSYPDVELTDILVDNCAMQLVRDPRQFDVIVTENLFGDILSDQAAMLTGSLGMLPSASLGQGTFGLYEPCHGSAPDIAGKGIANPLATILSVAMLLRYSLQREDAAAAIERAVDSILAQGLRTADIADKGASTVGTTAMGDAVVQALAGGSAMATKVYVYDTTLRDGSQMEGISFSVEDKVRIARRLDEFGVDYIEGGWPGAAPKDTEFFERMKSVRLKHAKLAAFGSTRRPFTTCENDALLQNLLGAETPAVTFVGKSWDFQVREALRVPLEENLAMIRDTVAHIKSKGREATFDAEHFFDGYKENAKYALAALQAAADANVDVLCLCDTNGGTLPYEIAEIVEAVVAKFPKTIVSMHPHNDGGCGTANALAAVRFGARQVQGTINGYGERTGNADLIPVCAALRLKMGYDCLTDEAMLDLTRLSAYIDEIANRTPNPQAPYVGRLAFTHKAGLHIDAIMKADGRAYEHVNPASVGNARRLLVSEHSGGSTIVTKAAGMGYTLDKKSEATRAVLTEVTNREHQGYAFESAEASFECY